MYEAQMSAYQNTQKTAMTDREIEASVLTRAANLLRNCQKSWENGGNNGMLDDALRFNQKIWSIFQTELFRPDHPMPKKLRHDILLLSAFIDRRTFEVMANPQPDQLNIIIDINLNLAAGLRGSAQDAEF